MYAVIENGSKQYKVCEGDVVRVEKLNANVGDTVEFNVVMVSDENGVKVGSEVAAAEERRKKALCPAAEHNEEQPNSVESRTDGGEEQQNSGEARKKIKAPGRGKEKVK